MTKVIEITVKKYGQLFTFAVLDNGRIEYRIGNGKWFTAKGLKDGTVYFIKKQEVVFKSELLTLDSLELEQEDYSKLEREQRRILDEKEKKTIRQKPVLDDALLKVDKWNRKVKLVKDNNNQKVTVCVHDFRIGNDKYRFIERFFDGKGLIINPDYQISSDVPNVGGVPKQYGELMFWDYLFPDTGWQRVRTLTFNEQICLEIIKKYGYFAMKDNEECVKNFKEYTRKPLFSKLFNK